MTTDQVQSPRATLQDLNLLGVCSWSLRPANPDDLIAQLQKLDIRAVQLALSPVVNDPTTWGRAFESLEEAGIRVLSGMMAMAGEDYSTLASIARTGGVRPNETWPANLDHARAIASLAAEHGIALVTFHAGFIPEHSADPERRTLLDRLRAIADLFAQRGLKLAFETGQENADTLLEALNDLDRPNVGVNFDPANMILYGMGDPIDALRRLAPHVRQVHVKDAQPTLQPGEWGSEVPVGQGAVRWSEFFELVRALPEPVPLVIEREAGDNRISDIAAARELIRRFIKPDKPSQSRGMTTAQPSHDPR